MHKITFVIALLLIVSVCAFGQNQSGKMSLGVSAETAVPMGDLSNSSNFGIGGLALGSYDIDQNLAINVKVGYLRFSGKDNYGSLGMVPILVGVKYFLTPPMETTSMRVYAAADAGLYMLSSEGGNSTTKFGVSPILGARFKAGDNMDVDLHAAYSVVFTDVSSSSWVGVGLGLVFGLQ